MKRLQITHFLFLSLVLVMAHAEDSDSSLVLSLPDDKGGFTASAYPLFLQPHTSGAEGLGLPSPDLQLVESAMTTPGYAWGFKLEVGEDFAHGFGVATNWYHQQATYRNHTGAFPSTDTNINVLSADTKLQPSWDTVNLELKKYILLGKFGAMYFHSGLQFSRILIAQSSQQSATFNSSGTTFSSYQSINHLFNGIGARFGIGSSREWGYGVSTFLNSATAVLSGTHSQNTVYNGPTTTFSVPSSNFSKSALVPELEVHTGFNYHYEVKRGLLKGNLLAEVGWLWINFIGSTLHSTYNATNGQLTNTEYSFGEQGLMFGLQWSA